MNFLEEHLFKGEDNRVKRSYHSISSGWPYLYIYI